MKFFFLLTFLFCCIQTQARTHMQLLPYPFEGGDEEDQWVTIAQVSEEKFQPSEQYSYMCAKFTITEAFEPFFFLRIDNYILDPVKSEPTLASCQLYRNGALLHQAKESDEIKLNTEECKVVLTEMMAVLIKDMGYECKRFIAGQNINENS